MTTTAARKRDDWARVAAPVGALMGAMLLLPIADVRAGALAVPLAVSQTGPAAGAFDLAVGQLLLAGAAVAWLWGPRRRLGTLASLAAVSWFGPDLFALVDTDPAIRAAGRFVLAPFLAPLLLHVLIAGFALDRRRLVVVSLVVLYLATAIVAIGSAASYDAFFDRWCIDCNWHNPFLVSTGAGAVRTWQTLGAGVLFAVALGGAATVMRWFVVGSRTLARVTLAVAGVALVGTTVARAALLLIVPRIDALAPSWALAWVSLGITCALTGCGVIALGVEAMRSTARMRRIATSLALVPAPGALEAMLSHALGDPSLRIGYRLEEEALVDEAGAPFRRVDGGDQLGTPIVRDGRDVAVLYHDRRFDADALAAAFGPTALVALDNDRLRAATLAQLAQLRESRTRIVAVGDGERKRLERDLHDGVQQQLLAIVFDVRLARLEAERSGNSALASRRAEAEGTAMKAVEELRRVAHGIYPAILGRSGLLAALQSLAERAPLAMEIDARGDFTRRLAESIESAAYRAVADSMADAHERGATSMTIGVRLEEGALEVTVSDEGGTDGRPSRAASVALGIADRIGAAGGNVQAETTVERGRRLTIEIPCAS